MQVAVTSKRDAATFDAGLRSLVNEARILARFDHPSLIKVYCFWEANGTAYMVMPYYEGRTLKQTSLGRTEPVDQASAASAGRLRRRRPPLPEKTVQHARTVFDVAAVRLGDGPADRQAHAPAVGPGGKQRAGAIVAHRNFKGARGPGAARTECAGAPALAPLPAHRWHGAAG